MRNDSERAAPKGHGAVSRTIRGVALLSATLLSLACKSSSDATPRQWVTVTRPAGAWQGKGSMTIGFVSNSGRFRIAWEARSEHPPSSGTFRLTVHSAVSGRPIRVVADHRGEGHGSVDFEDDPRPYNFMVDSTNVDWSFTVQEIELVDANERSSSSSRTR
jgi:hypothetical protein